MGEGLAIRASADPSEWTELVARARGEGFRFLDRLVEEWHAGTNRFDRRGERLLVAADDTHVLGIGGLNVDPYAGAAGTGRLRRLYVMPEARRQRIGLRLVMALLERAWPVFERVRLSTDTAAAARFYERLGFAPVTAPDATHILVLGADAINISGSR